ncbi:MAG: tRNA (5-methylaminomethyl-2-thiouridine)(34)-methyltransferase MnmD [Deltaproteobacteria bacterium]|nr:tRNA (5-methylaminomethyl-2-thiouridine)(34)-methyltransferase MnmD [Deltaproteobacteria bacterium]
MKKTADVSLLQIDDLERIVTPDGSDTFRLKKSGWSYRSIHGAQTESRGVFLEGTGLSARPSPWSVLEFGFGAGTTFLLTAREAEQKGVALHFISVDLFPVPPEAISGNDAAALLARSVLSALRSGTDSVVSQQKANVTLEFHARDWQDIDVSSESVQAVFYDPFGPKDQPEAWSPACFGVAERAMATDAVLGTYSSAAVARRGMQAAGLHVAEAKGPGRKREITFAAKMPDLFTQEALLEKKLLPRFAPLNASEGSRGKPADS